MDYIKRLFTQNATWNEVIPSTSSLTEESINSHALRNVRLSTESIANSSDTTGLRDSSGSVLYWLVGKSTCDGICESPAFKCGDTIETDSRRWNVVSVSEYSSLLGGLHHLEVVLT